MNFLLFFLKCELVINCLYLQCNELIITKDQQQLNINYRLQKLTASQLKPYCLHTLQSNSVINSTIILMTATWFTLNGD